MDGSKPLSRFAMRAAQRADMYGRSSERAQVVHRHTNTKAGDRSNYQPQAGTASNEWKGKCWGLASAQVCKTQSSKRRSFGAVRSRDRRRHMLELPPEDPKSTFLWKGSEESVGEVA